ncbi:enoyl-CoA hydratase/carnithine racemase [Sinorhizobium fredii]
MAMTGCASGHRVFERLATLRMPVIAALNGHALGGGLELAAAADIRIAERQVKVGLPETSLGMVPGWSGTQRLVSRFGAQIVRRMVLGGEMFSAEEAKAEGLVDAVVETGTVMTAARAYAARVASRGPAALEISKLMIASASREDKGAAVEALGSILVAKTGDLKEGVAAFSEKREARFKGEW